MHGLTTAKVLENGARRRAGGASQGQGRERAPVPRYSFIPDASKLLGRLPAMTIPMSALMLGTGQGRGQWERDIIPISRTCGTMGAVERGPRCPRTQSREAPSMCSSLSTHFWRPSECSALDECINEQWLEKGKGRERSDVGEAQEEEEARGYGKNNRVGGERNSRAFLKSLGFWEHRPVASM